MNYKNFNTRLFNSSAVWFHLLLGITVFYFIVHPISMVIYWFEMNEVPPSTMELLEKASLRFLESFSFKMTGMAFTFISLGSLVGLGSGLYYRNILTKSYKLQKQREQINWDLISIIKGGESDRVEFKSSLRYDHKKQIINKNLENIIVKTIAGFLNSNGGILLIGIDDEGKILGLEKDYQSFKKKNRDSFELKIYQLISTLIGIEFSSLADIDFNKIEEKELCILRIKAAKTPAYVKEDNKTAFYVRIGNSTRPLTIKEAVKYISINRSHS